MKILFSSFCLLIFCFSIFAAPAEYLRLKAGASPAIFTWDEEIEISFDLSKTDFTSATLTIYDFYGETIQRKDWNRAEIKAPQKITPDKKLGVFIAALSLANKKGKIIKTDETTFARIPDVRLMKLKPESPFGAGAYYIVRFSPEELAIASTIQNIIGAVWNREEFLWDILEPQKDKWHWEKSDRTVITARDKNILILGLLDYWGKWAAHHTDEGIAAYANYVRRVVERYKPNGVFAKERGWTDGYGVSDWEIWNEPATFWDGSGEQFGRLLKAAYQAAKVADPNCRVFFSEAGESFNAAAIKEAGAQSLDGVTPHFYCPPRTPEEGGIDESMGKMKKEFDKLGIKDKPFWVSEFGWHSTMEPGQMRHQAICLARTHIYGLAAGLDKFFWYNFVNDNRNKNAQHYGLVNREDWTPRFALGAYAAMVYFLEDAKFHSRVELARPARIFVFEKKEGSLAAIWSAGASGRLKTSFDTRVKIYDIMGNFLPTETIPLDAEPIYLVAPEMSAERLAACLDKGEIAGISSAELSILPIIGALKNLPPVRVEIQNIQRQPIDGVLKISAPDGWAANETEIPVSNLAGGASAQFSFTFSQMKPSPDNRYKISATLSEKNGSQAVQSAEISELAAIYGTPEIDGDASDWKSARFIYLDTPDKAVGLVPYMDWNLSAKVAAQWDENFFYFLGIVKDNVFSQPHEGSTIWEGDSFQIAFDARPDNKMEENAAGQYLFGLAQTKKGALVWSWAVAGRREEQDVPDIRFAFAAREKDIYVYEAAIPKKLLAPLVLKEGAQFGFNILLNDDDGGGRRGWLEWTPGIGTGFNPAQFTKWTLIK